MAKKKEQEKEECKVCYFVLEKNKENYPMGVQIVAPNYFCRRYPPTEPGIIQVAPSGWCGEYKPKSK